MPISDLLSFLKLRKSCTMRVPGISYSLLFRQFIEVQLVVSQYYSTLMIGTHNKALGSRIEEWNEKLTSFSKTFNDRHADLSLAIYDAYSVFTSVLDDPEKHGFRDVLSICYEECIWHDHIHPTAKVHELLAEGLLTLLNEN